MKKSLFLIIALLSITALKAQYNRPYRISYNELNKSYLITNRGDGKVLELDSFYQLKTVITGLKDPRDLVVGNIGTSVGLLVIDGNQIVVYDASTYKKFISFTIPSVSGSEFEDIEVDTKNQGYFYISDVGANRILKGKVGQAPFFTPSFKTLVSTGLNRPKGLYLNENNDLLVVTDEPKGKVAKIDTVSGKITTLFNSGLDSLNSIVQDKEGNYFLTNWGNSFLYRVSRNFTGLTKLTSYNKPAGMIANTESDLLVILCHLCNKIEFHKLHYFEPNSAVSACPEDSFTVDLDLSAVGIGTYNTGNQFVLEVSDASGNFNKPLVVGSVTANSQPTAIQGVMHKNLTASAYKYRIRSTSPSFTSSSKLIVPLAKPDLVNVGTSWSLCKGTQVELGRSPASSDKYVWTSRKYLSDSTIANPKFDASDTGSFQYRLYAENKTNGCQDSVDVQINVSPDIQLKSLNRDVNVCKGDSINFGETSSPYQFAWSPNIDLIDSSVSSPRFIGINSRTYKVQVTDASSGCKGNDSVTVTVNDKPIINVTPKYNSICMRDSVTWNVTGDTNLTYMWVYDGIEDTFAKSPYFNPIQSGLHRISVVVEDSNRCITSETVEVNANPLPQGKLNLLGGTNNPVTSGISIDATLGANAVLGEFYLITVSNTVQKVEAFSSFPVTNYKVANGHADTLYLEGFLKFESDSGCVSFSDTLAIKWSNIRQVFSANLKVYPNPVSDKLIIQSTAIGVHEVHIYRVNGTEVYSFTNDFGKNRIEVNTEDIPTGSYFMHLVDEFGLEYFKKIQVVH